MVLARAAAGRRARAARARDDCWRHAARARARRGRCAPTGNVRGGELAGRAGVCVRSSDAGAHAAVDHHAANAGAGVVDDPRAPGGVPVSCKAKRHTVGSWFDCSTQTEVLRKMPGHWVSIALVHQSRPLFGVGVQVDQNSPACCTETRVVLRIDGDVTSRGIAVALGDALRRLRPHLRGVERNGKPVRT